jgi:superfamily I DNA and/or RNA helicase/serine/threonine protein kinase
MPQENNISLPKLICDRYLLSPTVIDGRISQVFQATDANNPGRVVAVKVFKFGLFKDVVIQEAFEREGRILAEVQHPSIIPLLDFGVEPQTRRPFLVLDWGGKDLKASIDKNNIREWDNFYDLFGRGILEALAFAHSRGVVHRDLKPGDLLRTEDGKIRLADFGIAKYRDFLDHNLDLSQFVTEPFTPERGYDPNYSYASDVFGFGAITLDFLSNVDLKKWSDLRLALSQVQAPREILDILEHAVSPDPAVRPADAQILLAEINKIQNTRRRQSTQRRPCFVFITPTAFNTLKRGEYLSNDRDAQALVLREINSGSVLRKYLRLNRDTNMREYAEDEFSLYGTNMEFHLKVDSETKAYLVLVSARRPISSVDFDRNREEAWPHPFEFKVGRHPVPEEGRKLMADLRLGCDQFEHQRIDAMMTRAEENLFRGWAGMLQARSEQADRNQAVPYSDRTIEGNRVTFRTQQPLDVSVLEQFWEVPLGENRALRGIIDSVEGELVTMYVEGGVPNSLPANGILRLDSRSTKAALKRQKDALDSVKFGKAARADLKQFILHPESCQSQEFTTLEKWWNEGIDPDKKEAVLRALAAKDFFVLHGPPGTGKTTFITELILQFLARYPHKRVLLTSQTHIGVDNAIERLSETPRGLEIIRIGQQAAKIAESAHKYLLQNRIRDWNEQVQKKAGDFIETWSVQRGVNIREVRLGLHLGQLINILRNKARDEEDLENLRQFQSQKYSQSDSDAGDASLDAVTADQMRARAQEVEQQVDLLQERIAKFRSEERRLRDELKQSGPDGKSIAGEKYAELVLYQDELLGRSEATQTLRRLLELNAEWRQRFGVGDDCFEAILAAQHVVAGTCIGIGGLSDESLGEFDLCILDEASKATPTEALVPIAKSKKWILVGDPKQLPPYVDTTLQDQEVWEKYDLDPQQLKDTLLNRLHIGLSSAQQVQLTTQHRMIAPIGNLISRVFYDNTLKSVRTSTCPILTQVFRKPVAWLSTAKLKNHGERNNGASFLNLTEAQEILKLIDRIEFFATALKSGSRSGKLPGKVTVAILSGYAAQTEHIDHLLEQKRRRWQHVEVACNTVDAFQGREADLAVFSVTRSNPLRRAGFLHSRERINVALSRGRNGLCIVGDADFCRGLSGSPLAEVLEHVQSNQEECYLEEVAP